MTLPSDPKGRKALPLARGLLDYFPAALAAVADVSRVGNDQHNPGQPIHWSKHLSTDHADCLLRHMVDRGRLDTDGLRHSAKVAWRALAMLQMELEAEDRGFVLVDLYIDHLKRQAQQRAVAEQMSKDVAVQRDGFDVVCRWEPTTPCGCIQVLKPDHRHAHCFGGSDTHYCKDVKEGLCKPTNG
jgi:Domain of unknown function (DUF5664)